MVIKISDELYIFDDGVNVDMSHTAWDDSPVIIEYSELPELIKALQKIQDKRSKENEKSTSI